jgi:hypothetical protein
MNFIKLNKNKPPKSPLKLKSIENSTLFQRRVSKEHMFIDGNEIDSKLTEFQPQLNRDKTICSTNTTTKNADKASHSHIAIISQRPDSLSSSSNSSVGGSVPPRKMETNTQGKSTNFQVLGCGFLLIFNFIVHATNLIFCKLSKV